MASQTLASLLIHMPRRSVFHVHKVLLQMIQQNFAIPAPPPPRPAKAANGRGKKNPPPPDSTQKTHIWEIRHAGLLGVKYEVAVRSDLFDVASVKAEEGEMSEDGKDILRGVVDSAVLGYASHFFRLNLTHCVGQSW